MGLFFPLCIPFKMKVINTNQSVTVPDDVDVSVKSRVVTVKGERGTLVKSFKHLAVDISMPDKKTVRVEKWFGKKRIGCRQDSVFAHYQPLQRRNQGIQIQDEGSICPFPHQLRHF